MPMFLKKSYYQSGDPVVYFKGREEQIVVGVGRLEYPFSSGAIVSKDGEVLLEHTGYLYGHNFAHGGVTLCNADDLQGTVCGKLNIADQYEVQAFLRSLVKRYRAYFNRWLIEVALQERQKTPIEEWSIEARPV